jgi:hypothetical protein
LPYLPGEGFLAFAREINEKHTTRSASKTQQRDADTITLTPQNTHHNYESYFEKHDTQGISDWVFLREVCRDSPRYREGR